MKIKKLFIENGELESFGNKKQFAVVNFNVNTLISRTDLKKRADSMAFSKYK